MIRRPPRSTPLSLHDALPISCSLIFPLPVSTLGVSVTSFSATSELGMRLYFRSKASRSEEHTSELQSRQYLVCRLLLEKKKNDQLGSRDCNLSRTGYPPC